MCEQNAKQHILDNPDTYIGSVEHVESVQWILNGEGNKIVEKNIAHCKINFKK